MRLRTFFSILALAALGVNWAERAEGWSDDYSLAVGMVVMAVVMLISFPLLDTDTGKGPRR